MQKMKSPLILGLLLFVSITTAEDPYDILYDEIHGVEQVTSPDPANAYFFGYSTEDGCFDDTNRTAAIPGPHFAAPRGGVPHGSILPYCIPLADYVSWRVSGPNMCQVRVFDNLDPCEWTEGVPTLMNNCVWGGKSGHESYGKQVGFRCTM